MAKKTDMSFAGLLGESPRVKMLEFLLVSRGNFEYHVKDIAEGSGVSRPTCYSELRQLNRKGIVVKGSKYKGRQLYKLNKQSPAVKALLDCFHALIYYN